MPGNVDDSLLFDKIEAGEMPPRSRLARPQIEAMRTWIAAGEPYHVEPLAPLAQGPTGGRFSQFAGLWCQLGPNLNGRWVKTPIDAFILAKLKEQGPARPRKPIAAP